MFGGVSIPVGLNLAGFQAQAATATRILQGIGAAGTVAANRVQQFAVGARAFANMAIPAMAFAGQLAIAAFNMQRLSTQAAATANVLLSLNVGLPFLNPLSQASLQMLVFSQSLGAVRTALTNATAGFLNMGVVGKLAVASILSSGLAALPQIIGFFVNQTALVNQVFITGLIPNLLTVNALLATYQSFFATGLANPIRYTDWVVLLSIFKELIPKTTLLGQALNTITTPVKFARTAQTFINYLGLLRTEITGFTTQLNMLTTGLAASAASLAGGGGFLLPGQLSPGATVLDMFDRQQGVEEAVAFQQLTDNMRALSQVSGATTQEIEDVNRAILQTATATGQNIDQVANAASSLKRSGVETKDIPAALRTLGAAATATESDMMALGTSVLDLQGNFDGLTFEQAADQLTALSVRTGVSTNQLAYAINSVSGITKAAGLDFRETALAIASFTSAGMTSSGASRTLESTIKTLQTVAADFNKEINSEKDAEKLQKVNALQALGLSKEDIVDAKGQVKDFGDIISTFQQKVSSFLIKGQKQEASNLIAQIFGSGNANELLAVFSQTESAIAGLDQALAQSAGLSQQISDNQMSSLAGTLDRLTDGARAVSITVGQFLAPILNSFLQPVTALTEGFLKLPPVIQVTALGLSVLGPAFLVVFQGAKLAAYWTKIWAVATTIAGVVSDVFTGKLTALQVQQAISAQWTQILTQLTAAQSFAMGVLTGQITLAEAKQTLLNAAQAFGAANAREYFSTTKAAVALIGDYAKVLLLGTTNIRLFSATELLNATAIGVKNAVVNGAIALTQKQTYVDLIQNSVSLAQSAINGVVSASILAKNVVLGLFVRQQAAANTQQSLSATISLVAAQAKNIYAVAVGRASVANLGFIATMATLAVRLGVVIAAFWAISQVWKSATAGMQEARAYEDAAGKINSLTGSLGGLTAKTSESQSGWERFVDTLQSKGAIEAIQESLGLVTNSQLAAQRGMIALGNVTEAVGNQLTQGTSILQKYGLETLDAGDRQRLGASGIQAFKNEAKAQISILEQTAETLKAQKPANEEQKAILDANIKLTERQINLLRNRVLSLESDTDATDKNNKALKDQILTLEKITEKYKELTYQADLSKDSRMAAVEQRLAAGEARGGISEKQAEAQRRSVEFLAVKDRMKNNDLQIKDLSAAALGAKPDDAKKINEELRKVNLDQVKARIELAKLEQQERKAVNEDIVKNFKDREDAISQAQERTAANQIANLKRQQAEGDITEQERVNEVAAIERQGILDSIEREQEKQAKLRELRKWGAISEEELRKGVRDSLSSITKLEGNLAESELKTAQEKAEAAKKDAEAEAERIKKAIEDQVKKIEDKSKNAKQRLENDISKLDLSSGGLDRQSKLSTAQSGVSTARSNLDQQRLDFALKFAQLNGTVEQQEQIKTQIYNQQLQALALTNAAKQAELKISQQQAAIELERKRINAEIAIIEAQAALDTARAKNASAEEINGLQQVLNLRKSALGQVASEKANQAQINALNQEQLSLEKQASQEGITQQRQLDLQQAAIEKRNKTIEEGLARQKLALESRSQGLEFKGQDLTGQIDRQKALSDLQSAMSNAEKQRLDFALQRAELVKDENAKEQIKEQIYQQQRSSILAEQAAKKINIDLSRQQAAIELERQKIAAQIAIFEAQANLAKAQSVKTTSASEINSLKTALSYRQKALGQIDKQAANQKAIQSIQDKQYQIENQTALEQIDQTRELEKQRLAIEAKTKALEEAREAAKLPLEKQLADLDVISQAIDRESRKTQARAGLADAINQLDQQRLEYLAEQAQISGDVTRQEQLKQQIFVQQAQALATQFEAKKQELEISYQQKQIDLERQEVQAQIASLEAQANLEKAKAEKQSPQQIKSLEQVADLREKAISQLDRTRAAENEIFALNRQKLNVEHRSSTEKLMQSRQLEMQRKLQEANNKEAEKGNQIEKEKRALVEGISWVDLAKPSWNEAATTSFQKRAEEILMGDAKKNLANASGVSPSNNAKTEGITDPATKDANKTAQDVAASTFLIDATQFDRVIKELSGIHMLLIRFWLSMPGIAPTDKPMNPGDVTPAIPDTSQFLPSDLIPSDTNALGWNTQQMIVNAQSVSVAGQNAITVPNDKPVSGLSRDTARSRVVEARLALQAEIDRLNAEAEVRNRNIDPLQAAAEGRRVAALARADADRVRADLASGRLKTTIDPNAKVPELQPSKLEGLINNLKKAQADLKNAKEPVTLESIGKAIADIAGILKSKQFGNLTVVSQNPVAECGEILNNLSKRR